MKVVCAGVACPATTKHPSGRCSKHRRATSRFYRSEEGLPTPKYFSRSDEWGGRTEEWKVRGVLHRIGGPAYVRHHPKGGRTERWFFRGVAHRLDGAVAEWVDRSGRRFEHEFALSGTTAFTFRESVLALRSFPASRLRAELGFSSYGVLLEEGVTPETVLDAIDAGVSSIDGIREVAAGAPAEWVRAFESGQALGFLEATKA